MSGPSNFARDFGALIQKHIDRLGWTHEAVAIAVWGREKGADRKGDVSGYINARRGKPSAATIRGFADALSIPDAEIEALRTREREAAQAEAKALNIPLGFLDAMAGIFGDSETFGGWDAYADFMQAKAQDYARLQTELEDLRQQQPNTANRIPEIEALLAEGKIEQAEVALEALRDTATDKLLEGLKDLSNIMSLQADAALLRGDQGEAFKLWRDAAALFDTLAPLEGAALRNRWEERLYDYAHRLGGNGFQHSAALLSLNLKIYTQQNHAVNWATTQNNLGNALRNQGTRTEGQAGADLLSRAVDAYTAALEVRTRQDQPVDWAMTQECFAHVYLAMAEREADEARTTHLAEAVTAVDNALEIYDPETMSYRYGIATRLRDDILAAMEGR